ncbi:MAG: CpaF family protein [Candidatus Fermentimicrarchaeum limneticum]|uniref:CpaF family protein n=1 Tax=Fermentimicrarchaeum limneticum TaxID=2795018 RepID=A0A7D5XKD0_FERL1|nr:MAG: CpaF family protein [Candidatus Fermentimicrarchaeum limneticum]
MAEVTSEVILTKLDEICEALASEKDQAAELPAVASRFGIDHNRLERLGKIMQDMGILEVMYPVNILQKVQLKLKNKLVDESKAPATGKVVESYKIEVNYVPSNIHIMDIKGESRPLYLISPPKLGPYTKVFMDYLRDELARVITVQSEEISDVRKFADVRDKFYNAAFSKLSEELPSLEEGKRRVLAGILLHRMYGLGDIEMLMADDWLEEVAVNGSSEPISVYHRKFGWMKTNLRLESEEEIYNYAAQIGRKAGREISLLAPILDAHLPTGDRANATLFPVSSSGNTITIRRFSRNPWTLVDFVGQKMNTLSNEMAAFLWLCMQYEINTLIVGGTASGKTSTLNTLCALIPPSNRTITIEDTRELSLPKYLRWNWVPLTTRNANPEGKGAVRMLDLMLASLRMRPDRIVVGEIRRRREAEVLFEAMHTGHAVCSTMHADTASQVLRRLTHPPIELPMTELETLQLIVVQYRDRRKEIRRVYEISELVVSPVEAVSINPLFKWKARTDVFEKVNESTRVLEDLNLHTGMNQDEITKDISDKMKILDWMSKNGIRSVDDVGGVVGIYYKTPEVVLSAAEKNLPLDKVL